MTNPIQVGIRVTLQNQQETTAGIRQIGQAVVQTSAQIEGVGTEMATALNAGTEAVNRNSQAVSAWSQAGAGAAASAQGVTAASAQEAAALNLSSVAAATNAASVQRTSDETANFTRVLGANRQAEQVATQVAAQLNTATGQLAGVVNSGTDAVSRHLQVVNYWGETEAEATQRIREMVAASAQETTALNLSSTAAAANAESVRRTSEETASYARSLAAATAQMAQAASIAQPRQAVSTPEAEKYVATLQRQADMVGLNAAEQAQYQARLLGGTRATQEQAAAIVQNTEALRQQIAADQRKDQAATQFIARLKEQAATLGMTRTQLLSYQAAELGVADAAAPMIARLEETEEAAGRTGHATAGVKQELIVLAHEAISGNFSRMPGSFMVLAEQMNITSAMLSPMVLGFVSLAAVAGDLAFAYSQAHEHMIAVNNAIATTSNFAGVTESSIHDLAASISQNGQVTIGVAKDVVTELVASGQIGSKALATVAGLASDYAKITKKDVSEIAPELARLFSDPLKGAEELNNSMHFLTATDIEYIRTLKNLGESTEAQLVLAKKLTEHLPDQEKNVSALGRAWNAVKGAISGFNDEAGQVLNGSFTTSERIAQNEAAIARLKASPSGQDFSQQIAEKEARIAVLKKELEAENAAAKAAAEGAVARMRQKAAQDEVNKSQQTRIERLKEEQTLVANAPDSAAKSQRQLELQREIASTYRSMGAEDRAMALEQLGNQEALRQIKLRSAAEDINAQYQLGDLTKSEFDALMNANAVEQLQARKLHEQRLANVANQTAVERQAHLDRIDQINAEIALLQKRGDNQIQIDQKKAYDDVIGSIQKAGVASVASLDDQITKQKQHNAEIGKTKAQIEDAKRATLDLETAQMESDAAFLRNAILKEGFDDKAKTAYEMRLTFLEREIASRHTLAELLASGSVLESNAKAAETASKDWEKTTKSVQQNLADAIVNGGGNAWKKFKTEVANQVLTVPLQLVGNTVASFLNPSAPQAAGQAGGSSLANGLSLASSGYKLYNSGIAGIGQGISSAGSFLGSSTIAEFGAGFSGSAGAAAEALGASMTSAASAGAGLASALSTAIPYVAAAAVAYKVWNSFFEDGPESDTRLKFGSNNAAGNISINERGNEGKRDNYIGGSITSSFGTFGVVSSFWAPSDAKTVQDFIKTVGMADDALAKYLTTSEKASVTSYLTGKTDTAHLGAEGQIDSADAGKALAQVFTQRMLNILEGVEPGLSKLETNFQGTSAELATEVQSLLAYRAALRDSGEAVFGAKVTLQQIAALKAPTESTSAALQRVTDEFNATNQVAKLLGKDATTAFGKAGLESEAARAQIILLSGGISTFTSQASSYAQSFLTDQQRLAPVAKALNEQLGQLSLTSIPQTKTQFADLINSLDLSTVSGQKTYVSLMSLQEAFAQVHASERSAEDILKERADLQDQLDELTLSSANLLKKQRDALDESNRALFDQVQAAKAASEANKAAAEAAADAAQKAADALKAAKESAASAMQSIGNALADSMKRAQEAAAAFRALNDSLMLSEASPLSAEAKYAEAKRQFESADSSNLQAAEKAFLDASKAWFGNTASYAADFAAVIARNSVEALVQQNTAASIPSIWKSIQSTMGSVNGSHATGIEAVPFDNYRAVLHKGEEVRTASQVIDDRRRSAETIRLLGEQLEQARLDKVQRAAATDATVKAIQSMSAKIDKLDRSTRASAASRAKAPA